MNATRGFILALMGCVLVLAGCVTPSGNRLVPYETPVPPLPAGVHDVGEVSVPPRVLHRARPVYPPDLRRRGVEGEGIVVFTVRADGSVGDVVIVKASDIRFGQALRDALLKWTFRPAKLDGQPVACRQMQSIVFSVNRE